MLRKHSQVIRSLCKLADLIAIGSALYGVEAFREWFVDTGPSTDPANPDLLFWVASLGVYGLLLERSELRISRRRISALAEIRALIEVAAFGALITTALSLLGEGPRWGPLTVIALFGCTAVCLTALHMGTRGVLAAARRRGFNSRDVLVAGTGPHARRVADALRNHPEMGLRIRGFVGASGAPEVSAGSILGPYAALRDLAIHLEIDHVFIALDRTDPADPIQLVAALHDTTASVRVVPDLSGLRTIRAGGEELDDLPVLCVVENPVLGWSRVAKRGLDVVLSGTALLLLSPLLLGIALLIWGRAPRAPVLYRQRRMSLDAREFLMLKFRTMVPDAEAESGPVWARRNDPRCTKIGRVLRRTSLDELPQLWNVLRGHMSLVGPRPERPELIERFRTQIDGYMLRHKVKSGLTGLAQVHGLRGDTPLDQRIAYDLRYAAEWSIGLDLRILARTLWRVLHDQSAY